MSNGLVKGSAYTLGSIEQGEPCCEPIPHFSINNLAVSYHHETVLSNVSLEVYKGCITALIGPSGCGKSSFLTALNRLSDMVPGAEVSGDIVFEGDNIFDASIDVRALRTKIGMIFQNPNPFPLSIRKNLELPLKEHGVRNKSEIESKIFDALQSVGLWDEVKDRLQSSALSLSGGQQQRLCIARALILEPSVLLMDEPCSALDPISSGIVEEMIQRLAGRYTIIIVTHNLAQARRIANYAAFFWMTERVGKLIEFGQCRPLFESPQHALTAAYVSGEMG
jgi:phosphate transport system ATP-binding protein